MRKILIIKTGHAETFDKNYDNSDIVSLGDVLRTTVLLHLFLKDHVTWITSPNSLLLLDSIKEIQHLSTSLDELDMNSFDIIINLERSDSILKIIQSLDQDKIIGFINLKSLKTDEKILSLDEWLQKNSVKNLNWSEKLYLLFSKIWNKENYFISNALLNHNVQNTYDVGLNWKVGDKWPTKKWPTAYWNQLSEELKKSYTVCWQEGFSDITVYINWIHSCKTIITTDSLGLHIAIALNKKIITIYGPTSSLETPTSPNGVVLSTINKSGFECMPCYKETCHNNINCMESVSVASVIEHFQKLL